MGEGSNGGVIPEVVGRNPWGNLHLGIDSLDMFPFSHMIYKSLITLIVGYFLNK